MGTFHADRPQTRSIDDIAKEVIAGKHENGHVKRCKSLGISESEYERVTK